MEFNINSLISDSFTEGRGERSYYKYDFVSNMYPIINPSVRLNEDNTVVFMEFDLVDSEPWEKYSRSSLLSTRTSAALFSREESGYDIYKLVHDFTFGCLTQTTDIALSTYIDSSAIPHSLKPLLKRTPDYLTMIDGYLTLVEFGTSSSSNPDDLRMYYDVKMDYYSSAMDSLSPFLSIPHKIFVVIVGSHGVSTNMNLPEDLRAALVYRFRIAKSVDDNLYDTGLKIRPIDAKLDQNVKMFQQRLGSMNLHGEDEYSRENYIDCIDERIDHVKISQLLTHCWTRSIKYVDDRNWFTHKANNMRTASSMSKIAKITADLIERNQKNAPEGFNTHRKSIVNMPMIILKSGVPSLNIKSSKFMRENWSEKNADEVLRLWMSARDYVESNADFIDNSEETDAYEDLINDPGYLKDFLQDQPSLGSKPSETRNLYSRVKLTISPSDAIELAKVGVQGKKFDSAKESAVINYRKSRQLPFSFLGTDTSDIDDLMTSDLYWMIDVSIGAHNSDYTRMTRKLLEQAHSIHGKHEMTDKYEDHLRDLVKTPIFQWASLVSDIAFELCLALRQSCKRDVFIIKKLKNFQCYILIKPVRLSSKIFFSLLWFNDDVLYKPDFVGNVFRQPSSNDDVSWTEFVSLDQCKIENWALAESRTLAMIPYWLEFHALPPFQLKASGRGEIDRQINALQMMMFYTLIEIADKSEIEQEASLFRYMLMKSLTARPLIPEPELVIKKFKDNARSRLTIWIQRKLTRFCVYVAEDNIQVHQEDLLLHDQSLSTNSTKRMLWKGLINPYNGAILRNPGDAVNLMYIGYVQNKNLQPEGNVFGKMLKKIVALEDNFTPEVEARIGREDKPLDEDTKHEYNITLMKEATIYARDKYIPSLLGSSAISQAIEDVIRKITNTHIEEVFTTLKASSNFNERFFTLTEEEYHRAKVIEKAQLYVHSETTKVIDILGTCHEEVQRNGHMRIDIFQKNQHGGIREIYVLGFAERVVQWFIETLSRALCSLFPGETMTHPENKKKLPDEYFKNLRLRNGFKPTMTVATSADASKWSQNMYPHKFALMLCLLTPTYLHPIIWTSLAFWKNKYIMIPQSLIKRMHEDDNMLFYDKYMEGLYKAYKGIKNEKWAGEGQAYITVKTGMMQGILHYTSSLFHSIINVYIEAISMKYFYKITGVQLIPLIMQSSDDSCEILSCEIQETNLARLSALYSLCIVQVFKIEVGAQVGIQNSEEKTTLNTEQMFEFNSAYHFGPSRYESDIKMLSSSLICTDRENMVDRHMEQYTQLTNFINAGGTIYAANFIQMAQALFNYRLLGSSVTSRFSLLAQAYSYLPDPNLGFFALDNPLFTGLCGYKYNLWKIITSSSVGKTYKYYLNEALIPSERNKKPDLVTTKNGMLAKRAILGFGNRQKLLAIINRMSLPENWQELMDSDPSLYFRQAQNEEEFKIKCALKMFSPGVQESLSTGNITTRIMASSAYVTISTVMRSLGDWQSKEQLNLNDYKISDRYNLLQLVAHELGLLLDQSDELSSDELSFLFPYQDEYFALEAKLALCDYTIPKPKMMEYRRVITDVRVFERDNLTAIPPDRIMSAIWFKDNELVPKPRYSTKYIYECYLRLKKAIPWLDENLSKTLEEGPFDHINSLAAWLSQYHQKDKVVVIIGAPIVCRRGSSSILAVIRQNFHKRYEIENRHHDIPFVTNDEFTTIRQSLLMALSFPSHVRDIERRIFQILTSDIGSRMEYNPSASKSRFNTLCIMRDAMNKALSPLKILERIAECKIGIVGGYVVPQPLCTDTYQYYGRGVWIGKFYERKVKIEINSYYDDAINKHISFVERIFVDDIYPATDMTFCIKTWLDENRMTEDLPRDVVRLNLKETRTIAIRYARRAGLTAGIKTYYSKGKFTDNTSGIPIIIDQELITHFGDWTEFKIEVPVNEETGLARGVIKLMGRTSNLNYSQRERWVTLTRYVVHHKDYEGRGRDKIFNFPMPAPYRAWLENTPLTNKAAVDLINYAKATNDNPLKEHIREVLRNSFSKRGYRLGKKRDEMPLLKTAYSQYLEVIQRKGGSPEKKVPSIPKAKDIFTIENRTKEPLKVRWADEDEPIPSELKDFEWSSEQAVDKASLMKEASLEEEVESEITIKEDSSSISSASDLSEDEGSDEESEIDWGSDTDAMDLVRHTLETMRRDGDTYEKMDREVLALGAGEFTIDVDMDFGVFEEDLDAYLGDNLFKDLEMFNSSEYHITQSVNETNMRTGMVKREHCWFDSWISNWLSGKERDFSQLFHNRIITAYIKNQNFMSVMEFIYPDVTFVEEEEEVKYTIIDNVRNPFEEDTMDE